MVDLTAGHLRSVGTFHSFGKRPKVSVFNESELAHARKPHRIPGGTAQQSVELSSGDPAFSGIVHLNDGQFVHDGPSFWWSIAPDAASASDHFRRLG
jgi:hypothetical protein